MFILSLLSALSAVLILWALFSGRLHRKPRLIVLVGFCTAIIGAFFSVVAGKAEMFADAPLASQILGFAVASTGGSIMANGLQMRSSRLATKEAALAYANLKRAEREVQNLANLLGSLKGKTPTMSDEEFNRTLEAMRRQAARSLQNFKNAKLKLADANLEDVA